MARSIAKMARVAIILFEPKWISKGNVLIRRYGLSDQLLEVSESKAYALMVSFVVFQVIGKRIDKVSWGIEDMLQEKIFQLCNKLCQKDWPNNVGIYLDVWYISRQIIQIFVDSVKRK